MALEIKYSRKPEDTNGNIVLTNVTGEYDVTDNPTGFGAPNLSRSEVNIIPWTKYGPSQENIGTVDYIPDADEVITIPIQGDGIYETKIYALPIAYDYVGKTQQELEDNAVSIYTFSFDHVSMVYSSRKRFSLYLELEQDECKSRDQYEELIDHIKAQQYGAQANFCNGSPDTAHSILLDLTKYIDKSRI